MTKRNDTAKTRYEIVVRDATRYGQRGDWDNDGVGSENEFDSIEDAEATIRGLISLGDEWAEGVYGVREIGDSYVFEFEA